MIEHRSIMTADLNFKLEALLARFEHDRAGGPVQLEAYLPSRDDPQYSWIVTELARIDLEYDFNAGKLHSISPYLDAFPDVFQDRQHRTQLAFEEYRLRRWSGQDVAASVIAERYSVDGSRWPKLTIGADSTCEPTSPSSRQGGFVTQQPPVSYPAAGEVFAGYPLIAEVGRGAFSRVFLARQPDLASRPVVLKVTPLATEESDRLARLQHSAIIPVYSVHRQGDLSCICMPFLGTTTLADLVRSAKRWTSIDGPAVELVSTILDRRRSTINVAAGEPINAASVGNDDTSLSVARGDRELSQTESPLGLERFAEISYVDALLVLVIEAVEGLHHAHRCGIVHRDLKPANILVSDEGNAILLDFNLAVSRHEPMTRIAGGTLPYMSPQQLAGLSTGEIADARDDVFSVGVILYELLSGRLPFACPNVGEALDVSSMVQERLRSPESIRTYNRGVSPGLECIIGKCLAPDRETRYQNAGELLEDLHRHRAHQRLKHADDPSPVERLTKWAARHPRISSASSVATLAVAILAALAILFVVRGERLARLDIEARVRELDRTLPRAIVPLSTPGYEPEILQHGLGIANEVISPWIERGQWNPSVDFDRLSPQARQDLTRRLAHLAQLMSEAETAIGNTHVDTADEGPEVHFERAKQWNHLARQLDLGSLENERSDLRTLAAIKSRDASELRELAKIQIAQQPSDVSHWFYAAVASSRLGDWHQAIAELTVCDLLQPNSIATRFNRGLAHFQVGDMTSARDDFSSCLRLDPDLAAASFNRALCFEALGDLNSSLDDLDDVVLANLASTRVLMMRSRLHRQLGQLEAADADMEAARELPPRNADDYVARGVIRLSESTEDALQDFKRAIELQPDHFDALRNTAHVLADVQHQPAIAMEYLDRWVTSYPRAALPIASRGIMNARLGRYAEAIEDAEKAADRKPGPREILQIAGIHAIACSSAESEAVIEQRRKTAMNWLSRALMMDPALIKLATDDKDLGNLRSDDRFQKLLDNASEIASISN